MTSDMTEETRRLEDINTISATALTVAEISTVADEAFPQETPEVVDEAPPRREICYECGDRRGYHEGGACTKEACRCPAWSEGE